MVITCYHHPLPDSDGKKNSAEAYGYPFDTNFETVMSASPSEKFIKRVSIRTSPSDEPSEQWAGAKAWLVADFWDDFLSLR